MLKGILCPSKISGTQLHPSSVLLNCLFKTSVWEGANTWDVNTCKYLGCERVFPRHCWCLVLWLFQCCPVSKGKALPHHQVCGWWSQRLWVDLVPHAEAHIRGPSRSAWNQHPLPVVPRQRGRALECCSILISGWTTLRKLFEGTWSTAPLGSYRYVLMQQHEYVTNVTAKKLSFFLPAAPERLTSSSQLQSVCRLPIFSPQTSSSPSLPLN